MNWHARRFGRIRREVRTLKGERGLSGRWKEAGRGLTAVDKAETLFS